MRVLMFLVALAFASPAAAEVKAYLLLGASHMTGAAPISGATAIANANKITLLHHDGIFRHNGIPEPAHGGPFQYSVFQGGHDLGPTRWLAEKLAEKFPAATQIVMVPCAKGGTGLTFYNHSTASWAAYNACRARRDRVDWQGAWPGVPRKTAGVFIITGYADAASTTNANNYAANFENLVARLRADYGEPNLPVVHIRYNLSPSCRAAWLEPSNITAANFDMVQAQQDSINIPNVRLLVLDAPGEVGMMSDCLHPSAAGSKTIGHAMATAMWELETGQTPPDPDPEPLPMCPFPCTPSG